MYAVDTSFLKIFSLSLISGNPNTALTGENKFLLSRSTARKLFGDKEALGRTIHWEGMGDWQVSGVFEDLPENSHMKIDLLSSWMNVYGELSAWNWDGFYTYLLLKPNTDLFKCQELIQQVLNEKLSERPDANRVKSTFQLQPLFDIHLNSNLDGEMKPNGNRSLVLTLQLVAIIILTLAVINYLNLSLARTIKRGKEVGIRKIIGSTRTQLMGLFFTESFTFNLISLVIALLIFIFSSNAFDNLVGIPVAQMFWAQPTTSLLYVCGVLILASFIAAAYPARIIVSGPMAGLKKLNQIIPGTGLIRKSLLTIQFIITIALVTGTIVIQEQISFMQGQSLGFNIDQNLVIKSFAKSGAEMDSSFLNKMDLFKSKIKEHSDINNATVTSNIPGRENEWIGRLLKPDGDQELITT
ncbi:MAG: FtsX-like permease family protein, partial [Cyclobacteriaceae bacterium]